jgi:hypothetical protein
MVRWIDGIKIHESTAVDVSDADGDVTSVVAGGRSDVNPSQENSEGAERRRMPPWMEGSWISMRRAFPFIGIVGSLAIFTSF